MTIGVLVDPDWPFGPTKAKGARKGATKHAIIAAIQRHVLKSESGEPDAQSYAGARAAFAQQWQTFHASRPELKEIVASLAQARGEADPLFCVAFYGLCSSLAAAGFDFDPAEEDVSAVGEEDKDKTTKPKEEEEDGNDDGDDEEADDEEPVTRQRKAAPIRWLSAERTAVELAIANLLMRLVTQTAAVAPARSGKGADEKSRRRIEFRLIAKALLDCLLSAMPESFKQSRPRRVSRKGKVTTERFIVANLSLAARVHKLLEQLPYRFTVQPRDSPPKYADVNPHDPANEAKIHIPLIGYRRTNWFLNDFLDQALQGCGSAFDYTAHVGAINVQQAVSWRINVPLLTTLRLLHALTEDPAKWDDNTRSAVAQTGLDETRVEELRGWLAGKFYKPDAAARDRYKLPGAYMGSPLAQQALTDLAPKGAAPHTFYLPWKADYRGRIYAETPWLTPQGGDLQRALFEFAQGRPLDGSGLRALRRHGAGLVKGGGIARDLEIRDAAVATLADRERWVEQNEAKICASAAQPLSEPFWREVAKRPLQFLAFCLAYKQWKDNPETPIHLPVQIDGTCNGLQHIAALTGNANLARAVNVLANQGGGPRDIYSELADAARQTLGTLALPRRLAAPVREALGEADRLLRHDSVWQAQLDRDIAKAVVMTVPYGAGEVAQCQDVAARLQDRIDDGRIDLRQGQPLWPTAMRWNERIAADEKARKTAGAWAAGTFRAGKLPRDKELRQSDREERRVKRHFVGMMANAMVRHLRAALKREYPCTESLSNMLRKAAARCEGLPLMWLTPLGLPVCQDKFLDKRESVSATLMKEGGFERISVDVPALTKQVSETGQRDALLPNIIHSLDATHLAMMLNAARGARITDIGTIHDCLLSHANDAECLAAIARDGFCELYRPAKDGFVPAVLQRWSEWMYLASRIAAAEKPDLLQGCLDHPGGAGEKDLEDSAASPESKDPSPVVAQETLELIRDIRALPAPEQALAKKLVAYANTVPREQKQDATEPRRKKGKKGPSYRKRHESSERVQIGWGVLPLAPETMSNYFFS